LSCPRRTYTPPQLDWPDRIELTGFTVWSGPSRGRLDAAVETYLDDGPAPVLVTLGTSTATVAGPILRDVAAALDRIGQRGLFLVGTADNMRELDGRAGVFELHRSARCSHGVEAWFTRAATAPPPQPSTPASRPSPSRWGSTRSHTVADSSSSESVAWSATPATASTPEPRIGQSVRVIDALRRRADR